MRSAGRAGRRARALLGLALALTFAPEARGESTDQSAAAEALFREAMALIDAGQPAAACPKFEASLRLESGFGVLFNLADCHERIGRTATAWAQFREAEAVARGAGQSSRGDKAAERASALEPKLVRLRVEVDSAVAGLEVRRGGQAVSPAVWATPIPVDPGSQLIEARAPGHRPWSQTVDLRAPGSTVTVRVPALEPEAASPPPPAAAAAPSEVSPAPPPPSRDRSSGARGRTSRRTAGVLVGAAGVVALGVGTAFGLVAIGKKDDAEPHCPRGNLCDADGVALRDEGLTASYVSTGLFVGGAALGAAGIVLFLTAPAPAAITPSSSASLSLSPGRGVTLQGRW